MKDHVTANITQKSACVKTFLGFEETNWNVVRYLQVKMEISVIDMLNW